MAIWGNKFFQGVFNSGVVLSNGRLIPLFGVLTLVAFSNSLALWYSSYSFSCFEVCRCVIQFEFVVPVLLIALSTPLALQSLQVYDFLDLFSGSIMACSKYL